MVALMRSFSQSDAMTEVALALAMAFFAVMVLAMVSMGASLHSPDRALELDRGVAIQPSSDDVSGNHLDVSPEALLIHFGGQFFDSDLERIEPNDVAARNIRVLAITPNLSIAEAIAVRERLPIKNIEVTVLTDEWLRVLEEKSR